jgi:hypothetical protein
MPTDFLVNCLVELRAEFNTLSPNRDKGADGWIGDPPTSRRPPTTTPTRPAASSPSTSTRPGRGRRTSTPS